MDIRKYELYCTNVYEYGSMFISNKNIIKTFFSIHGRNTQSLKEVPDSTRNKFLTNKASYSLPTSNAMDYAVKAYAPLRLGPNYLTNNQVQQNKTHTISNNIKLITVFSILLMKQDNCNF